MHWINVAAAFGVIFGKIYAAGSEGGNDPCYNDSECPENAYCYNGYPSCDLPGICQCIPGYLMQTECYKEVSISEKCGNTTKCREPMECDRETNNCTCKSGYIFHEKLDTCVEKGKENATLFGQPCTKEAGCHGIERLMYGVDKVDCVNGVCGCPDGTYDALNNFQPLYNPNFLPSHVCLANNDQRRLGVNESCDHSNQCESDICDFCPGDPSNPICIPSENDSMEVRATPLVYVLLAAICIMLYI